MQSELFPLADRAVVGSHTAVVLFEIHQIVYISSDQGNIFGITGGGVMREILYKDIPESVRKLARLIHTMPNSNAVILGIKNCIKPQRQSVTDESKEEEA